MGMRQVGGAEYLTCVRPRGGEEALIVHAGDYVLELTVMVFCPYLGVEGLEAGREYDCRDIDLLFLRYLIEVYGLVFTYRFADPAFLLFQVEAALVDVGDEGNGLREVDMNSLVLRYLLIEPIRVLDRAVFDAGSTPRAFILQNVAGTFDQGYFEVARFPFYPVDFSIGEDLYVRMPADLDQLGCEYSHRAVVGRKGLIELGHVATDARRFLNQVHLETGGGEVEGCLNTTYPSTDDHDVAEIAISNTRTKLLDVFFQRYYIFHSSFTSTDFVVLLPPGFGWLFALHRLSGRAVLGESRPTDDRHGRGQPV
jgi:hypothetical protein